MLEMKGTCPANGSTEMGEICKCNGILENRRVSSSCNPCNEEEGEPKIDPR